MCRNCSNCRTRLRERRKLYHSTSYSTSTSPGIVFYSFTSDGGKAKWRNHAMVSRQPFARRRVPFRFIGSFRLAPVQHSHDNGTSCDHVRVEPKCRAADARIIGTRRSVNTVCCRRRCLNRCVIEMGNRSLNGQPAVQKIRDHEIEHSSEDQSSACMIINWRWVKHNICFPRLNRNNIPFNRYITMRSKFS